MRWFEDRSFNFTPDAFNNEGRHMRILFAARYIRQRTLRGWQASRALIASRVLGTRERKRDEAKKRRSECISRWWKMHQPVALFVRLHQASNDVQSISQLRRLEPSSCVIFSLPFPPCSFFMSLRLVSSFGASQLPNYSLVSHPSCVLLPIYTYRVFLSPAHE